VIRRIATGTLCSRRREKAMHSRLTAILAAVCLCVAAASSRAALAPYTQNFETLVKTNPSALGNDGWLVYGNVYDPPSTLLYGYGPFPAPNGSGAFCAIDANQGGPLQGTQQLSVYSDYNNTGAHGAGQLVESIVYREQPISAGDVGTTWTFQFDAKLGNLASPSTANAFIKTIDPSANYATTNLIARDMTAIPTTWMTYAVSITVTPALVGQLMQFGFASVATNFNASGVFYDNIVWTTTAGVEPPLSGGLELMVPSPNPCRTSTNLTFSLSRAGPAHLSIYDLQGREVVTLFAGLAGAGAQTVRWDGRFADGRPAPAGIYTCLLSTEAGRQARRIVLGR
jgi:hypothetical protein